MAQNVGLAKARSLPICQDTGTISFYFETPRGVGIGGAAQIYAQCVRRVVSVRLEQFGSPEAVWELEVQNFPAVVAIDSHGNNLQQVVTDRSRELLTATLWRRSQFSQDGSPRT